MAEYIEKNVAIVRLTALEIGIPCATMTDAKLQIADTPAADVVPVVRCKDCKHSWEDISGLCCSYRVCIDLNVPRAFYCAYGERKDGGDNNAVD